VYGDFEPRCIRRCQNPSAIKKKSPICRVASATPARFRVVAATRIISAARSHTGRACRNGSRSRIRIAASIAWPRDSVMGCASGRPRSGVAVRPHGKILRMGTYPERGCAGNGKSWGLPSARTVPIRGFSSRTGTDWLGGSPQAFCLSFVARLRPRADFPVWGTPAYRGEQSPSTAALYLRKGRRGLRLRPAPFYLPPMERRDFAAKNGEGAPAPGRLQGEKGTVRRPYRVLLSSAGQCERMLASNRS
jgi:hypothetical protein